MMGMKRLLAGLIAFCALSAGMGTGAAGMSLEEFYRLDRLEKENFMTTVLHFFHNRYTQDPAASYKARCMVDLYNPAVGGNEPKLLDLILENMATAHADSRSNPTVEKVVETVVERECTAR